MTNQSVMVYRALCNHGVVRAMVVDDPSTKDLVCESLGEWPLWAHTIDHVTVEESRKSNFVCSVCDEQHQMRISEGVSNV